MTEMRLYGMGKMLVRLPVAGIHEIPTSWLPLHIIVGARFVHDMIVQRLAKDGTLTLFYFDQHCTETYNKR